LLHQQTGDRILEVNGTDVRHANHEQAVAVIRSAGNPVIFLVQSLVCWVSSPHIFLGQAIYLHLF